MRVVSGANFAGNLFIGPALGDESFHKRLRYIISAGTIVTPMMRVGYNIILEDDVETKHAWYISYGDAAFINKNSDWKLLDPPVDGDVVVQFRSPVEVVCPNKMDIKRYPGFVVHSSSIKLLLSSVGTVKT